MRLIRLAPGEHDALRVDASHRRLAREIPAGGLRLSHHPENTRGPRGQQPAPDIENLRRDLVTAVEAAEYEALLGQAGFCPGRPLRRDGAPIVIRLEAVGQVDDLFRVVPAALGRYHKAIRQEVVDVRRAAGAGKSEITHLHRGGPV